MNLPQAQDIDLSLCTYRCRYCGSDKVQESTWAEINSGEIVGPSGIDGPRGNFWCPVCAEEPTLEGEIQACDLCLIDENGRCRTAGHAANLDACPGPPEPEDDEAEERAALAQRDAARDLLAACEAARVALEYISTFQPVPPKVRELAARDLETVDAAIRKARGEEATP